MYSDCGNYRCLSGRWLLCLCCQQTLDEVKKQTEAGQKSANAAKSAADVAKETLDEMKASGTESTNQADKVIDHLNRLAGSFKKSTEYAKSALDTSVEAMRLDQRAWIGIPEIVVNSPLHTSESISYKGLSLVFRNTGKTPAINSYISFMLVSSAESEPPFDFDKAVTGKDDRRDQNYILQPKKAYGIFAPGAVHTVVVSPPAVHRGQGNLRRIYILGKTTYRDVFPGTPERMTKFCFTYQQFFPEYAFVPCPEGNWMD